MFLPFRPGRGDRITRHRHWFNPPPRALDMIPNLTTFALIWVAGSLILLPLMILTVRLAVLPLVETITRARGGGGGGPAEARIARLEQRVGQLGRELERMTTSGSPDTES
jgi:hypothetical protein